MKNSTIHVGFVLYEPRFGAFVWTLGENCLRTEAQKRGMTFTTVPVRTVEEQAVELTKLLIHGIDAVVMKPMASDHPAITEFLHRAAAAKVPVVTLDSPLSEGVLCTVGSDNTKGQALVAEHVFGLMQYQGRLAYFRGDDRVPAGVLRTKSFHQTLSRYPKIDLVYEMMLDWVSPVSRRIQGAKFMREALKQSSDLDAVVSTTDEGALGAMDVLIEEGLSNKILVAGFDGIPEALLAVKNGTMALTVRQLPRKIASKVLDVIEAAMLSKPVERLIYVDTELITADKVDASALDSLELIPGLIHHLAANHEDHRKLQQTIITTQQNILQTVAAVSNAVRSIREPDDMMRKVVDLLTERFELHRAALYTMELQHEQNSESRQLVLRANSGVAMDERTENALSTLVRECIRTGESCSGAPATALAKQDGDAIVLSELALPLISGEHVIGVLDLQSTRAKAFDPDVCSVLQAIAHQVTIAIENANLYRETVQRAKAQEENREQLLIAEKMASLGRLTAGIAHEMNTPLAAVRSAILELESLVKEYRESIGDKSVNDEDHNEIANEMTQSLRLAASAAERAAGFVRGVKSQTRDLTAQQLVSFNAVTVIQEAILLLSHAVRQGKCEVHFHPDADAIEMVGSPGRLAQIVTNLISNAVDASADKGGGVIDVSMVEEKKCVVLRVSDKGSGIPAEILPKIFDPMFTTKPFGVGTGLGLTIVHDIVTGDFSGKLDIESVVGEGTSFVVRLARNATV